MKTENENKKVKVEDLIFETLVSRGLSEDVKKSDTDFFLSIEQKKLSLEINDNFNQICDHYYFTKSEALKISEAFKRFSDLIEE